MTSDTIAFIGGGNMARSLISGLLGAGTDPERIVASDPLPAQRELLTELGIRSTDDNVAAASGAGTIVLAVKPQMLGAVLKALPDIGPTQLLVSIAAGVPIGAITAWTRPDQPVVRCMPNTPALLGAGITALYANAAVDEAGIRRAEDILSAAGRTLWVDEEAKLDAVTAVSGSGPAYFFYLMEAMIEAGIAQGLDAETATVLTLETAYGAALMARERTSSPAALRANVTSPGGTTAAAIAALEAAGAGATIRAALNAARDRAQALAREFGQS
ncbi:MAG TPA: pyrroline-5-carboxylate reductase [Pseudomonadales bacterium]